MKRMWLVACLCALALCGCDDPYTKAHKRLYAVKATMPDGEVVELVCDEWWGAGAGMVRVHSVDGTWHYFSPVNIAMEAK